MQRLVFYLVLPPILVLFAAQLTVLVSMNQVYPEGYPDLIAPFDSMMPGQWITDLEDPPCAFQTTPGHSLMIECELPSDTSPFAAVFATVSKGSIVQTWFRANDVLVGDVIRHWGRPDVVVTLNHRSFYLFWADHELVAFINPVGPVGQFNYMQPVEHFTIGLENRP